MVAEVPRDSPEPHSRTQIRSQDSGHRIPNLGLPPSHLTPRCLEALYALRDLGPPSHLAPPEWRGAPRCDGGPRPGRARPGVLLQLTTPCPAWPPARGVRMTPAASPLPGLDGSALQRQPRWWAQGRVGETGGSTQAGGGLGGRGPICLDLTQQLHLVFLRPHLLSHLRGEPG